MILNSICLNDNNKSVWNLQFHNPKIFQLQNFLLYQIRYSIRLHECKPLLSDKWKGEYVSVFILDFIF